MFKQIQIQCFHRFDNINGNNRWMKRIKIGLLGGSFDPPHLGHIGISKDALNLLSLDEIWWLPTKQNPLKSNKNSDFDERLAQCLEISKNEKKIIVKDTEKSLETVYFIDLLEKIIKENPENEFFFLIGADNLINFHLWHKWKNIIDLVKIAVFERENYHDEAIKSEAYQFCQKLFKERLIFLKNKKYDISSTKIRQNQNPTFVF